MFVSRGCRGGQVVVLRDWTALNFDAPARRAERLETTCGDPFPPKALRRSHEPTHIC